MYAVAACFVSLNSGSPYIRSRGSRESTRANTAESKTGAVNFGRAEPPMHNGYYFILGALAVAVATGDAEFEEDVRLLCPRTIDFDRTRIDCPGYATIPKGK